MPHHVGVAVVTPIGTSVFWGAQNELIVLIAMLIDQAFTTFVNQDVKHTVTADGLFMSVVFRVKIAPCPDGSHTIQVLANEGQWHVVPVKMAIPGTGLEGGLISKF